MRKQQSLEPYRLDQKLALITGGASGIGAATCRCLSEAGAKLVIADINLAAASRLARTLPRATALQMDVTNSKSIQECIAKLKRIDILVNNAGIGLVGGILDTSEGDFDRVMNVNVRSIYLVTRAALPFLVAAHGCIVNIGSVAGYIGVGKRFAYCASKGAVLAMTRQLAVDYPKLIRVNCIAPGTVDTPFVSGYLRKYYSGNEKKARADLIARQPIGRLGSPEDVAGLVRYLCSSEASFMTGSVITIDGGWTAM